jgi:hypothetical protein
MRGRRDRSIRRRLAGVRRRCRPNVQRDTREAEAPARALPVAPLAPDEFKIAWPKMAAELARAGIVADKGCKTVNRLYFACVSPSPARWNELGGARILTGAPINAETMLDAARADREAQEARAKAAPKARPVREQHRDKYIAAAIRHERGNIEAAGEGGRHDALLKAAWALARFGLGEDQIADAPPSRDPPSR